MALFTSLSTQLSVNPKFHEKPREHIDLKEKKKKNQINNRFIAMSSRRGGQYKDKVRSQK